MGVPVAAWRQSGGGTRVRRITVTTLWSASIVIWVPVALTTVIFCRAARRRRVSWRWPLLTAATLAVFPGMMVRLAPSGDWMLIIGVSPSITAAVLLQALLPLTIAGWYSWRRSRLERLEWAIDR